jgi:YidC/Oxa1 family membrane protein insertase
VFAPLAWLLAAFYALWPSYGFAIVALTTSVLVATFPLTLRTTRSASEMQRLQPELRRLREQHRRHDRQRLNQEIVALYRRHGVNPGAGCLPLLLQLPLMIIMYRVIRGLTHHDPATGAPAPRYLDHGSSLYHSLQDHSGRMVSWGIDLSTSALSPHGSPLATAPFFVLAGLVVATSSWQQRLALARSGVGAGVERTPGQAMIRVMPAFAGLLAITLPAAVAVYYLISNLFRVAQQHLIRRLHPPPAAGESTPG